jgi:hypothetical protein
MDHCTASPNPRAIPAGCHHLLLCFEPDGGVTFYPQTDDPPELDQHLATVVRLFVEHPSLIRCAAQHHAATDPHQEN